MRILFGVVSCFFLSGFAALLYQTAWMRQFSVVFGTSELAVAAVLSAYMGGLALGAGIAARYVHRVKRPVLFYGGLEAGIAIAALSVPLLLTLAKAVYVAVFGGQPDPVDASGLGQPVFYLITAFIVLAIPTTLMGATLPLLTKYVVRNEKHIGPRVGLLYAANTVGAVCGTVLAGFFLLPALGLAGTVYIGIAINLLVFVIAVRIARIVAQKATAEKTDAASVANIDATANPASTPVAGRIWVLPVMLISGANAFVYEVLWTRLLGHILGGSITAFATMLASFLGGIAIGSAIASRFATTKTAALNGFIIAQCGIAVASMAIYQYLPLVIPDDVGLRGNILLAIAILLPATLFIGATYPLAVKIFARDKTDAAPAAARVYAFNTIGAIAGATLAAFLLIPMFKYEGAIHLAVVVNAILALSAAVLIGTRRLIPIAVTGLLALATALVYQPQMPTEILRTSPVVDRSEGEIRYYEVGRSATVLVLEENGFLNLRTNGLPEASTNLKGAPPYQHNQRLLSTLPVLARPDTEEILIVGFGAGATLEGVPPSVRRIDVVELEPKVVDANRLMSAERQSDPLTDPRIHVYINDARSALSLTSKKYDAIVSQPSHPWTAGASHLYTREFMQLANEHLTDDGVYLQWMNTQFIDADLLRNLAATMLDVFDHVRVYQWDAQVMFFLGSAQPLNVELDMAKTGRPLSDDRRFYREIGVGSVEDAIVALTMDHANVKAFARGATVITDDFNIMATRSAAVMDTGETLGLLELFDLLRPYDPLLQANSFVHVDFPKKLDFTYVSRRLERLFLKQRAIKLADTLLKLGKPEGLVMIGIGQRGQGEIQESQRNLLLGIDADPMSHTGRYALLQPWFSRLARDEMPPQRIRETLENIDGTAATVVQARIAAGKGNQQAVESLDHGLAEVSPTDLWYLDAVKLRVDWRIKAPASQQPNAARAAIRLIDEAIAIYQDPDLFSMRLAAAFVADSMPEIIETSRRLIYIFGNEMKMAEEGQTVPTFNALQTKAQQIAGVTQILSDIAADDRVDAYKVAELQNSIEQIKIRLLAMAEAR